MRGECLLGHIELGELDVVLVRNEPAAEHVAGAGHRGQARGHQPTGARLGRRHGDPLRARLLEHELLDRPVVLGEDRWSERLPHGDGERLSFSEELDPDLPVVRADRRLDALRLAAHLCQGACDGRFADAVDPEDAAVRRLCAREHALHGLVLERRLPQAAELGRRAG